jgi:hypothetical protein
MNIMTVGMVKHARVVVDTTVNRLKVLVDTRHQLQHLLVLLVCIRLLVNQAFSVIVKMYDSCIRDGLKPELFIQQHALQSHA